MEDEEALKESVSNLRSSILLGRTDIVRSILSTAADCMYNQFFFFLLIVKLLWLACLVLNVHSTSINFSLFFGGKVFEPNVTSESDGHVFAIRFRRFLSLISGKELLCKPYFVCGKSLYVL